MNFFESRPNKTFKVQFTLNCLYESNVFFLNILFIAYICMMFFVIQSGTIRHFYLSHESPITSIKIFQQFNGFDSASEEVIKDNESNLFIYSLKFDWLYCHIIMIILSSVIFLVQYGIPSIKYSNKLLILYLH